MVRRNPNAPGALHDLKPFARPLDDLDVIAAADASYDVPFG
jgi:hypothetical protein